MPRHLTMVDKSFTHGRTGERKSVHVAEVGPHVKVRMIATRAEGCTVTVTRHGEEESHHFPSLPDAAQWVDGVFHRYYTEPADEGTRCCNLFWDGGREMRNMRSCPNPAAVVDVANHALCQECHNRNVSRKKESDRRWQEHLLVCGDDCHVNRKG